MVVVRGATTTTLWSRQGKDFTARFPDIARASGAQLPSGSVVDGEVVIWAGDRLEFGLLQRRLVTALHGVEPGAAADRSCLPRRFRGGARA